jgi:hypothetical protein
MNIRLNAHNLVFSTVARTRTLRVILRMVPLAVTLVNLFYVSRQVMVLFEVHGFNLWRCIRKWLFAD